MKALDSWARQFGYADFDTFIRGGGSILDAAKDIAKRIRVLSEALKALPIEQITEPPAEAIEDEPPDPDNAHVQGAEHGEP